uniref:Uncharacterized protein n=1 Tax=Tanacetum cinerariifolium TaxID=118510 RepID=A0A699I4F5_TANCI|nr:hypothetical protein [Tanacetum cinerariifolium]
MGYEKSSTKLAFYKAFFLAQWKFLIHIILQFMSAKRTAWNEISSSMASAIICLATEEENDDNEVSVEPTPTSPTPTIPSPSPTQEHIPSTPQAQTTQLSSPSQQQPSQTIKISMTLLNTLGCIQTRGKIAALDANEDVTLEAVDAEVAMDADVHGRLPESQTKPTEVEEVIEVVTAAKFMTEVVTTVATTFNIAQVPKASAPRRKMAVVIQDPEETTIASVIMHSEVKSKYKGKGILVEEPKPLKRQAQIEQDEAFARQLEAELNANINWNDVVDQVKRKEKHDNIVMRYQDLKRKHVTEAHARKNMMVYFKNMARFKMDVFRGMTYTNIRPIFEKHYNSIQVFLNKGEEEITEQEEGSKRKDVSPEQRAAKKHRID